MESFRTCTISAINRCIASMNLIRLLLEFHSSRILRVNSSCFILVFVSHNYSLRRKTLFTRKSQVQRRSFIFFPFQVLFLLVRAKMLSLLMRLWPNDVILWSRDDSSSSIVSTIPSSGRSEVVINSFTNRTLCNLKFVNYRSIHYIGNNA